MEKWNSGNVDEWNSGKVEKWNNTFFFAFRYNKFVYLPRIAEVVQCIKTEA